MGPRIERTVFDEPHHECGFALLRLLKPLEYYEEKYGTSFFGLNRMYLMMEKQRNRGQDGCGLASVKLDVPPGTKYISCEKSVDKDPIKDVFERAQRTSADKIARAPREAMVTKGEDGKQRPDPQWIKENVPFAGELFLAHVRYGTDSDNSIDRCHPVLRESNWLTRSLLLAGNFNITNNEDLFASLVQIGQHPRELSDTVTLLEKIGHFVDKENNDLYVKYSASGQAPRTCFSLIAENINVARILRRASTDWDGGYCIAGLFGHGDCFVLRDPCGIRPAFYLANDEVVCVASEAPLIQTVFNVGEDVVKPLPPGQALVVKRSGHWKLEGVLPPQPLKQCSFERIYFSRGNDSGVYREREQLGRFLLLPLVKMLEAKGDSLANAVLSFIPNTSELAFNGLYKEALVEMDRRRTRLIQELFACRKPNGEGAGAGNVQEIEEAVRRVGELKVRAEKVVHKDAKIRTFIQEDTSREHLTMHAYDVHYGTVKAGEDVLVALDDSIVRGNTLKNAILRTLDRLGPKRILVLSSCPQIRYPDVYGIDMAKLGDLAAFKAAISLLEERGMGNVLTEVYKACRAQLAKPLSSRDFTNHVTRIYEPFTVEEISAKIVEQITPSDCQAEVGVLFNTVDALHEAMPEYSGDWYFTGDYPTPGGTKVCCRAFVLWFEGSNARCYGVSSASSCAQTPVLVIGHGGAEHALAWKLSQSHEVGCVYVAPGNAGSSGQAASGHHSTTTHGDDDPQAFSGTMHSAPMVPVDVPLTPPHFKEVKDFCKERSIVLAVIGQEQLLREGLADQLRSAGVPTFGPSQVAAEIESSRAFSKSLVERLKIPMAPGRPKEGDESTVEVSVLAFSDGVRFKLLPVAVQEQKRALDGERGAITDGMGAFAPSAALDEEGLHRVADDVVGPILEALRQEERAFVGCLQTELILTPNGPMVSAFRTCLGDPTAQAALPLFSEDLFEVLSACAGSRLNRDAMLGVRPNTSVVAVVMASGGYPGTFQRGHAVSGIDRALCVPGVHVFHTGTSLEEGLASSTPKAGARRVMRRSSFSNVASNDASWSQRVTTCGGRVLTVAAVARSLCEARERSYVGVRAINFSDAWYRHDVAALASVQPMASSPRMRPQEFAPMPRGGAELSPIGGDAGDKCEFTYRAAGVDNAACGAAIESFEPLMMRTWKKGDEAQLPHGPKVCEVVGGNMLVSSTNALGTKVKVAAQIGIYETLGIDLVALCVNDIAARGAEPLFFHEHLSIEKLDGHQAMKLVKGISDGCLEAGCRLLDTSVAELPGVFASSGLDFVGFAVGNVQKASLLPRVQDMAPEDSIIGLPATGFHSNGFSLVRAIIRAAGLEYSQAAPFDPTRSLGEALLPPTRIYAKAVLELARQGLLKGAAQVAHGGLEGSLESTLPPTLEAHLRAEAWELPAELRWLAAVGKVPCTEMMATFNCGLGMLLIVKPESTDEVFRILQELHEEPVVVGALKASAQTGAGSKRVVIHGAQGAWLMLPELGVSLPFPQVLSSLQDPHTVSRKRTLVLAGAEDITPLNALFRAARVPASAATVVGVASMYPECMALSQARSARIKQIVLGDGRFKKQDFFCEGLDDELGAPAEAGAGGEGDGAGASRSLAEDFCAELDREMAELQVEILLVLDDVDTGLFTKSFLQRHMGQVLLAHASLLPAFPGRNPLHAALRSGTCVTGCTVSFAVPPSIGAGECFGPQVHQDPLRIALNDNTESLRQRLVEQCMNSGLARALQLVASGSIALRKDEGGFGLGRSASFTEAATHGMLHHDADTVEAA